MTRLAAVSLFVLLTGCEAPAAPTFAPSFAPRRAGPWQQFCEQAVSVPQASALAAARGADGFELVAMYNGVLCYKRPAPLPAASGPLPAGAPHGTAPYTPVIRDPGF